MARIVLLVCRSPATNCHHIMKKRILIFHVSVLCVGVTLAVVFVVVAVVRDEANPTRAPLHSNQITQQSLRPPQTHTDSNTHTHACRLMRTASSARTRATFRRLPCSFRILYAIHTHHTERNVNCKLFTSRRHGKSFSRVFQFVTDKVI